MARSSGVGALLTGLAIGATAVFLSDEKNREKVRVAVTNAANSAKDFQTRWMEDPDQVIAELKSNAAAISAKVQDKASLAGDKVTEASKKAMIATLDQTEKSVQSARAALENQPAVVEAVEEKPKAVKKTADKK